MNDSTRQAAEWVGHLLGDLLRSVPREQHEQALQAVAVGFVKGVGVDSEAVEVQLRLRYWGDSPAAPAGVLARCRHCAALIWQRPGQDWWEDAQGLTRCMKLPLADVGGPASLPGHEPMPEGLPGAPGDAGAVGA